MQATGVALEARALPHPPRKRRLNRHMPLLWFAPVLALLAIVTLYPTLFVIWISFQKTNYFEIAGFVGLGNYIDVFTSGHFWDIFQTSVIYLVGSLSVSLLLGVFAAVIFDKLRRLAPTLRVLTLFPWTLSMAVVGSIWLWMLNPSYGPIAYTMRSLGMPPGLLLGDPDLALPLTILVTSWWSFPYVMVMTSAAMQSIPKELYEALGIDGGNALHAFRYVTWPAILPTVSNAGLNLAIIYLTLVTLMIVLTGGGPLGSTTTLSLDVFRGTIQSIDIGPVSVMSIVVLLFNVVLGVLSARISQQDVV